MRGARGMRGTLLLLLSLLLTISASAQIITTGYRKIFTAGGGVGVTHVQSCIGQQNPASGTNGSPVTCTFSNPVGAGHLLVIANTNGYDTLPTWTFTGDSGTAATAIAPIALMGVGNEPYMGVSYIASAGGGETVITGTVGNANFPYMNVDEYACTPTCSLDVTAAAVTGTGPTMASELLTTTTNGDLVIGVFFTSDDTFSPGSGFTKASNSDPFTEYMLLPTAGSVTAIATMINAQPWGAEALAFKP